MEAEKKTDTSNIDKLYNNPVRKRELVKSLEKMLDVHVDASRQLTEKAWEILRVASAVFGVIAALEITLTEATVGEGFWLALVIVLGIYVFLVREVLRAIAPVEWPSVPGTTDGVLKYNKLVEKYVACDEDTYLTKLIVDYSGADVEGKGFKPGAIQRVQENNKVKALHIKRAARLLVVIIIGLIGMSIFAVV